MNPNDINAKYYDQVYSNIKGEAVTYAECTLISGLAGEPPKFILDVGAGTGRHALKLSDMGYQVTAIDSSKGMLEILASKKKKNIKIIYGDIFTYSPEEKYELIILMWNVFNEIALTNKSAKQLLQKLNSLLTKNGKILINIENVSEKDSFIPVFKSGDKFGVNWENVSKNKKQNITISRESVIEHGEIISTALIKQRWWKFSEIKSILKNLMHISIHRIKENNELYIILRAD